jgi:uncharacterized protein YbaR (Trm112 family)
MATIHASDQQIVGASGLGKLCCPTCHAPLEWVESQDGAVTMRDGVLMPAYAEQYEPNKLSAKEAFCCGVIYRAAPSYVIATEPEE